MTAILAALSDDHVVARVEVGGIGGLVLALEDARDARREAAERLPVASTTNQRRSISASRGV